MQLSPFPQIRKIYFCFIERVRTLIFYFSPIFKIRKKYSLHGILFFPKDIPSFTKSPSFYIKFCFEEALFFFQRPIERISHFSPFIAPLPRLSVFSTYDTSAIAQKRNFDFMPFLSRISCSPFSPRPVFLLAKIVKRYEKIFHIFSICLFEDQKPTRQ